MLNRVTVNDDFQEFHGCDKNMDAEEIAAELLRGTHKRPLNN